MLGLGIYDYLAGDISDPDTGEIYPAISCCNNETMAERCTVPGAARVIWSIKATPDLNSSCAFRLLEGFRSGRIRLLANEYDGERFMTNELRGFKGLTQDEQLELERPYYNTTLLIDEMTKLRQQLVGANNVKLTERAGMRKDRYSSLSYNYYVATEIESRLRRRFTGGSSDSSVQFIIRQPKVNGKAVKDFAAKNNRGWFN